MSPAMRHANAERDQVWLRVAHLEDADAIARLVNQAFQVERFFIAGDRTNPEAVRELLGKGKFLLAELDGVPAGCVYLQARGDRCYLGLLSVDPGRQRSGLGRLLMRAAEEDCRAAGARGIDLQIVSLRTELPGYYRCLGYDESGTAPFPEHAQPKQPCYFIKMSKELA
jgi:N-acetylglutamate synthase-like GNAT family acetyltransferase